MKLIFHILLLLLLAPPVAFAQEKGVFSIVRIEPADRENFYLKFGYDDALVKENQLNGDYATTTIAGKTYYMPWLNIQQGQNASMKLNLSDYNASTLLPSTYFVIRQDTMDSDYEIRINDADSIVVSVDNFDNPFNVTCNKSLQGHVNVYCCDSVNSQRLLVPQKGEKIIKYKFPIHCILDI